MALHVDAPTRDRGLGTLINDVTQTISRLFRQELALAKAELGSDLGRIGAGAAMLAAGGLVLFAGVLALIATAIIALTLVLPAWLAALIVAVVVMASGGVLLLIGRRAMAVRNLVPRRTLRTLREDAQFAVDHAERAREHRP
jgi:hypothetical protein